MDLDRYFVAEKKNRFIFRRDQIYLISVRRGTQWILSGQHGGGNHNADQYHVAEVTMIAEPVAEHAKPAKYG